MSCLAPAVSPLRFQHTAPWGCETRVTVFVTKYRLEDKIKLEHTTTHADACACRRNSNAKQEKANDALLARRLCDFWYAGQLSSMEVGETLHLLKWGQDDLAYDGEDNDATAIKKCVSAGLAWDPVDLVWDFKPWNCESAVRVTNAPPNLGGGARVVNI